MLFRSILIVAGRKSDADERVEVEIWSELSEEEEAR